MNECRLTERRIRSRGGECRRARSDDFANLKSGSLELRGKSHDLIVAAMRGRSALRELERTHVPVVVVQAAEIQTCASDRAHQFKDIAVRVNSGAVHAWVHIHEHAYSAATPLRKLRSAFDQ